MAQSTAVADSLTAATGVPVELVEIVTTGDRRTDVPLHEIGGQGVFVKEVQRAVLDGRADLAVHSAKDLPSAEADGLRLAAFCERRDPRDALIGSRLDDLAAGATVATGSVRRRAQLAARRPDLNFVELRGNIDTRLSKVPDGGAIVMAVAALEILALTDRAADVLPVEHFVPAVGQGCVAVECRDDDERALDVLRAIDHERTRRAVEIERAHLAELGAGCTFPVGAHVRDDVLYTFLGDLDGGPPVTEVVTLRADAPIGTEGHSLNCAAARRVAVAALAALR